MSTEKRVSNNISSLKNCYGCGVCGSVCPQNIIKLIETKNGFYKPIITSHEKCTSCGLCLKTCAFASECKRPEEAIESYAAWSDDPEIRFRASTGGVAYEIAKYALAQGYYVCGVIYNTERKRAEHVIIDNESELKNTLGSKYIPSYSSTAFNSLLAKENRDKKFAVFGTPCQIASLRLAVRKYNREADFLLVDFFCHGVPSLLAWDKYVMEKKLSEKSIDSISWRDKQTGWHDSWYIIGRKEDDTVIYRSDKVNRDEFFQFFLSHYALAQCCLESCKFKKMNSLADIRVGDLWGEKYNSNQLGINGVLCLTTKGNETLRAIESVTLNKESADIVAAGQMAKNAVKPVGYRLSMLLLRHSNLSLNRILTILKRLNRLYTLPSKAIYKLRNI